MVQVTRQRREAEISPPPPKKRKKSDTASHGVALLQAQPPAHWLRVYSWNVNGIAPFIQSSITSYFASPKSDDADSNASLNTSLRGFLRRQHWPQVLQLQEVKINPSDEETQKSVGKAINLCRSKMDEGPQYVVKFCLPTDKYNATGFGRKVYGVATIMRKDFFEAEVETVRTVDWDTEGRVLVVETRSRLSIWNVYAVNGTTNPYRNPASGEIVGTRHDRKLAFHSHMLDECKRLETDGYRLVLAGDMNVARAEIDGFPNLRTFPEQHVKNRFDFNMKFFQSQDGLRAIDSFRHLHPQERKYTWLARTREWMASCDRVDMIILSRSLVEDGPGTLMAADIMMTPADRGPSDHVPLFVALDLSVRANETKE